jgi:hypothetical protein
MTTDGIEAAWAAARAAEPDTLDRDDLAALVDDIRRVRSFLDAVEMRSVRRLRHLQSEGRAESPENLLANHGGRGGREARAAGERDELCNDAPEVEDALGTGAISGEVVDAIAAAAKGLPDDVREEFLGHREQLLERAQRVGLDTFRRECRELAKYLLKMSRGDEVDELAAQVEVSNLKRWVDRDTGMHHTHLELDPVRDAKLASALRSRLSQLRQAPNGRQASWQQLEVDAFLHAVVGDRVEGAGDGRGVDSHEADDGCSSRSYGAGGRASARVDRLPEITVLIDFPYLSGVVDSGICETEGGVPLPVGTVRRLACDAEIIPTVLGGDGELLDHGRSRRTASRSQRRALRALHRTCAQPDCSVGYDWCRLHHIRWWWQDLGPTDIDNLIPLCERHHHLVHKGGWGLAMTPDRIATWTRPDGTVHHTGSTIDRRVSSPIGEAGCCGESLIGSAGDRRVVRAG